MAEKEENVEEEISERTEMHYIHIRARLSQFLETSAAVTCTIYAFCEDQSQHPCSLAGGGKECAKKTDRSVSEDVPSHV